MRIYNNTLSIEDFKKNLSNVDVKVVESGFYYNRADSRCWTLRLNPDTDNIWVTYHVNKEYLGDQSVDILSSEKTMIGIEPEYVYDIIDEIITKTDTQED